MQTKGGSEKMLRSSKGLLVTAVLFAFSSAWAGNYQPGEVLVKYKDGTLRTRVMMNSLYSRIGVQKVRRYTGIMKGVEQLVLDSGQDVDKVVAELSQDPSVAYAQPNYLLYAQPIAPVAGLGTLDSPIRTKGVPCIFPGVPFPPGCEDEEEPTARRPDLKPAPDEVNPPVVDPDLAKAYGLEKVGAQSAWDIHKGDSKFIVADIDTGIDYNHEDLAFNVWRNPTPAEKNDVVGYDFVHNDGLPFDDNGHGTHTAGTIGAVGGNGIGISGVSQKVAIMSLKFLSAQGSGTTADAIRAIDYAITHGAKVLSNSWGGRGDPDNKALYESIERAKAADVLFIAAAGNDGADNDGSNASYPAAFNNDNLISVAATDQQDKMAYFSNYGKKTTHLAAPGAYVHSTMPGNKYKALSGTSMACPHVAGAAALVWSYHPEWNYKQVKDHMMGTVDLLPSLEGKTITGGRLNVSKAIQAM